MSEPKKSGLFVTSKKPGPTAAATPAASAVGPKDVKKRWLYVGAGLVGLVVLSSSIFGSKPIQATAGAPKPSPMINTAPKNGDSDAFTSRFAKDLESLRAEQDRMGRELALKDKKIDELSKSRTQVAAPDLSGTLPPSVVPPPINPANNSGGLNPLNTGAPPPPPDVPRRAGLPNLGGKPGTTDSSMPILTPPMSGAMAPSNVDPLVFDAPASDKKNTGATGPDGVSTKSSYKKNGSAGLLPAGAFAPFALLNGVDAGTSTTTQSNPMPVLMRITDQATLPGSAKYHLKSCFALGTAYGDMSAERVYGRVSRISCVDKSDRLILSQEVQGYLVDSDGKLGLRGTITDRQGAKMGKALLAGFAQGLAGALGSAQSSVTSNAATGSTTSAISGDAAVRAAGLAGAQNATSQLAQFYLKEAQAIFPVITVDAGRTGTLVFSASTALAWSDGESQFVQQVAPASK